MKKLNSFIVSANEAANLRLISFHNISLRNHTDQVTFTCSKSTIETLAKGVKYVQS